MYALPVDMHSSHPGLPDLPPPPDDDPAVPEHPARMPKQPASGPLVPHEPPALTPAAELLSRPAAAPPAPAKPMPAASHHAVTPSPLSAGTDAPPDLLPDSSLLSPDSAMAATPSFGSAPSSGLGPPPSASDSATTQTSTTGHSSSSDYFSFPTAGARRKPRQHGHQRGAVSQDALDVATLSAAHLRHWTYANSPFPGLASLGRQQPAFAAASSHPAGLYTTRRATLASSSKPPGFHLPPAGSAAGTSSHRPLLDPLDMSFRQAAASRPIVAPSTPPKASHLSLSAPLTRPIPVSPPRTRRRQTCSRQELPELTPERTAQAWAGGVGHFAPGLRLKLLEVLDSLVDEIPLPENESQTVTAVEYGALHSRGHPILQAFVSRLSANHSRSTLSADANPGGGHFFSILHTDMPGTDFREVMLSNERDQVLAQAGVPHLAERMFESYTARAFGAPVAPPGTVRFGLSLMDLHWAHPRAAEVPTPTPWAPSSEPPTPDEMPDIPFAGGFPSALPLPSPHPLTPPALQQAQQSYFTLHGGGDKTSQPGSASATLSQIIAGPAEKHASRPSHASTSIPSSMQGSAHVFPGCDPRPAHELSTFLSTRAKEFAPGGVLLVAYLAAPSEPVPPLSSVSTGTFALPKTSRSVPDSCPNSDVAIPGARPTPPSDLSDDTHDFWAALTSLLAPCIQRLVSTALVGPDVARRMLALPLTLRTPHDTRTVLAAQQDWEVVWSCGLEDEAYLPCEGREASPDWPESEYSATRVAHPAWAGLRGGVLNGGTFATELVELVKSIYDAHLRRILRTRARLSQGAAAIVLDTLWDHLFTRVQDLHERDHPLLRLPVHVEICTLALRRKA